MIGGSEYSTYTLAQLFKARYWEHTRGRLLEAEIQKRCANIRARTNGERSAAAGSSRRFRPYGLIFGVAFLLVSAGPYVAVTCLGAISAVDDASGDLVSLAAVWALLTLPFLVAVFLIGAIKDAEQVGKWLNLTGPEHSAQTPPRRAAAVAHTDAVGHTAPVSY